MSILREPAACVPPLDIDELTKALVGKKVRVPRLTNPYKVWYATIEKIVYVAPNKTDALIQISGHSSFGNQRQCLLSHIQWQERHEDPLARALYKQQHSKP